TARTRKHIRHELVTASHGAATLGERESVNLRAFEISTQIQGRTGRWIDVGAVGDPVPTLPHASEVGRRVLKRDVDARIAVTDDQSVVARVVPGRASANGE